jgi:3-methylcrotonyl-CoA carboxylase alpha subunit
MIKSVLIANRGEIACRVIKTAKRMGIRTIAVYSEADAQAKHVRMADEAYLLGPAAASDSYLRSGRILAIAKEAGADAIHPGYGFLSENADFAQLTEDAGMVFVGPPPAAIRAMGLKDRSKEIMTEAGVPVVPGYHGQNQDPTFLKRKAYEIGYPLLIKAVAGGGGKGMRKVDKALEFDDALDAAKREAQSSFGNDIVLLEKFVQNPRHIEIQVFGDAHGNVVHLFERDCSLQRRHQKVIEEAPAPGMTEAVRNAMGKAACDAAQAVGYQGAGTVEFIADGEGGLSEDGFFFMEMNTRLQVEHPVTEMITGQDLVEWQLRVASGEELPAKQEDLSITGHAFEARIYAEDASSGFLPSIGRLVAMDLGQEGGGVRIDSGVEAGDDITPYYDPMIAKLIVHGASRSEALAAITSQLQRAKIAGPVTNTAFLAKLCSHKGFAQGHFNTSLIDENLSQLVPEASVDESVIAAGVVGLVENEQERLAAQNSATYSPWSATDAFQTGPIRSVPFDFILDGEEQTVQLSYQPHGLTILNGNGESVSPSANCSYFHDDERVFVLKDGHQWIFEPRIFELRDEAAISSDGAIKVPMHGKVITVTVVGGDVVEEGDILFSVEAMKMEHSVVAPYDGVVAQLAITAGEQVENGAVALILEAQPTVDS